MDFNTSKVWGNPISVKETVLVNENLRFDPSLKDGNWSMEVTIWLIIWITLFVGFTLANFCVGNSWYDKHILRREKERRGKFNMKGGKDIFII